MNFLPHGQSKCTINIDFFYKCNSIIYTKVDIKQFDWIIFHINKININIQYVVIIFSFIIANMFCFYLFFEISIRINQQTSGLLMESLSIIQKLSDLTVKDQCAVGIHFSWHFSQIISHLCYFPCLHQWQSFIHASDMNRNATNLKIHAKLTWFSNYPFFCFHNVNSISIVLFFLE